MKRITQRDIELLTETSSKLAAIAETVRAVRAPWVAAVIQLLTEANDAVLGLRDRALAVFRRVAEAEADKLDDHARAAAAESETAPAGWPGATKPEEE